MHRALHLQYLCTVWDYQIQQQVCAWELAKQAFCWYIIHKIVITWPLIIASIETTCSKMQQCYCQIQLLGDLEAIPAELLLPRTLPVVDSPSCEKELLQEARLSEWNFRLLKNLCTIWFPAGRSWASICPPPPLLHKHLCDKWWLTGLFSKTYELEMSIKLSGSTTDATSTVCLELHRTRRSL